ncbi:MAG TPA: TfoX/Sxy family protein [Candidatus Limnocylindria bacterium]|nr:TfoX/Sxy family protein [Candidatus Limnocylindria bacterium]
MKATEWAKAPPELVETFTTAVAELGGAQQRKMFGYPAAFANGNMFTGIYQDRWFVRLGEDDRRRLAAAGGSTFEPMRGRPMREYLELPASVLSDDAARADWLQRSLAYALSLPPKAPRGK